MKSKFVKNRLYCGLLPGARRYNFCAIFQQDLRIFLRQTLPYPLYLKPNELYKKEAIMKKFILPLSISCVAIALSACSSLGIHRPMSLTSPTAKPITTQTLADGTSVQVGMKRPIPSWKCREIDSISYDWKKIKSESTASISPSDVLISKALKYADDNHLRMNYIFINTPDHGITNATYKKADTIYYQCQKVRPK